MALSRPAQPLPAQRERDDAQLRRDARGIEDLLAEAQAHSSPEAWALIEECVGRLVQLYGSGLTRAIDHARQAGADRAAYDQRLAGDELLSSLLVLHGLHPRSTEERVRGALAKLAVQLGAVAQLAAIDIDGAAYIHLGACALPDDFAAEAIRHALLQVAPELARVVVHVDAIADAR
jgi:hypothetical protein